MARFRSRRKLLLHGLSLIRNITSRYRLIPTECRWWVGFARICPVLFQYIWAKNGFNIYTVLMYYSEKMLMLVWLMLKGYIRKSSHPVCRYWNKEEHNFVASGPTRMPWPRFYLQNKWDFQASSTSTSKARQWVLYPDLKVVFREQVLIRSHIVKSIGNMDTDLL